MPVSINLQEILTTNLRFQDPQIDPGDTTDLIVEIENEIEESVDFNFSLDLPIRVVNPGEIPTY